MKKKKSKLQVVLADKHRLVRAGFSSLLAGNSHVDVVDEARDGRELIRAVKQHRPDLVITGIDMAGLNGIDAVLRIRSEFPETKILIISAHAEEQYVVRALRAGASGYVTKDAAVTELELSINAVAAGRTFLGPSISRNVVNSYLKGIGDRQTSLNNLTQRQREILQLIAEGKSTKEIAFDLKVSAKTVETHRERLMNRLNIRDVPGLVRYAIRSGLVSAHR